MHIRPHRIRTLLVLACLTLSLLSGLVILARAPAPPRTGKFLGMAVAPETAVQDMLQVSDNHLQQFQVLIDAPWGWQRLLIFSYTVQPRGYPPHNEFGYASTELRWGWSAHPGALVADARGPVRVTYASAQLDGQTIVYGKLLDPAIRVVEATFDTGETQRITPTNQGFLITTAGGSTVRTLRAWDAQGRLLHSSTTPELDLAAFWN